MKIIADVGNPVYYGQRACELIKEVEGRPPEERVEPLKKAISLLGLAVAEIELNAGPVEEE